MHRDGDQCRPSAGVGECGAGRAGIVVPAQIIARPFAPPKRDTRYTLDDGIIVFL